VNFPFVFKSIVKENGGVSKARNAGIGAARGKYIGFIDSDDSIRPETCELFERAILLDSDIIIAAYYKQEKNGNIVIQGKLPFEEYTKMDIDLYLALLYGKGHAGQAAIWNKLYRAELIKDKPIPSMKTEDVAWSPYIASYAQTFSYIDTPLYEYLRREGSTSDIINKNTSLDIFERRMKSINYFIENGNPQKRGLLYEIAKKRLEWHIKFTDDNSLYIQELDRLRSEHSNHESL
jgi:glycosyltransferase involved in cell wall biosynthesis